MARRRLPGLPVHGLRRSRRRAARRTPTNSYRGPHRLEARRRGSRPARPGARGDGSTRTAPGAAVGPADGRPVPSRASSGGSPSLHASPGGAGRPTGDRAGSRAPTTPGGDPLPRPRAGTRPAGASGAHRSNRRVSVQRARTVRDGRCGVLLRSGAGGRRGRWSSRRGEVPRARRTLGEREVLPAACGPHACTRIGRAAGQRSVGLLGDPPGRSSARCVGSRAG